MNGLRCADSCNFEPEMYSCLTAIGSVTVYGDDTSAAEESLARAPRAHGDLGLNNLVGITSVSVKPAGTEATSVSQGSGNPLLTVPSAQRVPVGSTSPDDGGAFPGGAVAGIVIIVLVVGVIVAQMVRRRRRGGGAAAAAGRKGEMMSKLTDEDTLIGGNSLLAVDDGGVEVEAADARSVGSNGSLYDQVFAMVAASGNSVLGSVANNRNEVEMQLDDK